MCVLKSAAWLKKATPTSMMTANYHMKPKIVRFDILTFLLDGLNAVIMQSHTCILFFTDLPEIDMLLGKNECLKTR